MTTATASARASANRGDRRPRFSSGPLARHLVVLLLGGALMVLFAEVHGQWSPMHRWNRTFGDVSVSLVALAMSVGPLGRLWRPAARAIPYRRELGIWGTLAGLVHAVIILVGWVELDLMRIVGFEFHPGLGRYVMVQQGFALANIIGLLALVLSAILALTSNDFSLRRLGASAWKFLQMGAVPLWWMIVAHVVYFLFIHFVDFHRQVPAPNPLQWPFAGLVLAIVALRTGAYVATVKRSAERSAKRAEPVAAN